MPTLDLALVLGMVRCAVDVIHTLVLEPDCKIAGDVGRTVVAEEPGRARLGPLRGPFIADITANQPFGE